MISILCVLVLILASCFPQRSQSEKAAAPVLTIARTGGYVGVEDRVSVFADGKIIDDIGKVRHVRSAMLEGFVRSVEKVGYSSPDKATTPRSMCFDCFVYKISVWRGDASEAFVFEEPFFSSSGSERDDTIAIRNFLGLVFSNSHKE